MRIRIDIGEVMAATPACFSFMSKIKKRAHRTE